MLPPGFPSITLSRNEVINLLLGSIGLEEIKLSYILNEGGEEIQSALGTLPNTEPQGMEQVLEANENVQETLAFTIKKELLLNKKLTHIENLLTDIPIIGPVDPMFAEEGFIATTNVNGVNSSIQIDNWEEIYNSGNFDNITGIYNVPETGKYMIFATVYYETETPFLLNEPEINPKFIVQNITTSTNLVLGLLPKLLILFLYERLIPQSGKVTLYSDVELNIGDEVGLFYESDGLTIDLNIGDECNPILWSIYKISN